MNVREQAEQQAKSAVALVADDAARAHRLLSDAVAWFDQHRPEWGPGTLPIWYTDARDYLRHTD